MTKYELYQILDENGYEPSEENLAILTEDESLVEELLNESKKLKRAHKRIEAGEDEQTVLDSEGISQERYSAYKHGKKAAEGYAKARKAAQEGHLMKAYRLRRGGSGFQDFGADGEVAMGMTERRDEIRKKYQETKDQNMLYAPDTGDHIDPNKVDKRRGEAYSERPEPRKTARVWAAEKEVEKSMKESLTTYELYQILDENGFEPSDENFDVLVEGFEGGFYALDENNILYEKYWDEDSVDKDGNVSKGKTFWRRAGRVGLAAATLGASEGIRGAFRQARAKANAKTLVKAQARPDDEALQKKAEEARKEVDKAGMHGDTKYTQTVSKTVSKVGDKYAKSLAANRQVKDNLKAIGGDVENTKNHVGNGENNTISSYKHEDYDLYKLLDVNGFEPTNENLEILKEELEDGNTVILSIGDLVLTESMGDDDVLSQILVENGFKVNENNLTVLAEAIENGHVLLEKKEPGEEVDLTDKESTKKKGERVLTDTGKKVLKTAAIIAGMSVLGGAAGAGAGYHLGKLNATKGAEVASAQAKEAAKASETAAAEANAAKQAEETAKANVKDVASSDAYQTAKNTAETAQKKADAAATNAKVADANSTLKNTAGQQTAVKTAHAIVGGTSGAVVGGVAGAALAHKANQPKKEKTKKPAK